jgi:osmoprotectant transport system ATP-binding protein
MINRLIEPSDGTVHLDGLDIQAYEPVALRRSIGYVFQGIGLFPHFTVRENIAVPLRLIGASARQQEERTTELMNLVGLPVDEFGDRLPLELSGGQQQRVAVARALANDPEHLLMDEPFGALDAVTRDTMQQELLFLKKQLRKTIIFVTHEIMEALTLADRIAVLHDGRLQQAGSGRALIENPANDFVRDLFVKSLRRLESYRELLT